MQADNANTSALPIHNCRNSTNNASNVREHFSEYFMSAAGRVSWQLSHLNAR